MKKFCIVYSYTTNFDTEVAVNNKKEAVEKVREVVGECQIEGAWEIKEYAD